MTKTSLLLTSLFLSGCAAVDPFVKSDEANMAKIIKEANLAKDLDSWIKSAGNSAVVFINMEDNHYTDDQLPEYMVLDAIYSNIKDGNSSIRILERDPDILGMLQRENDGVDLPASWQPEATHASDSLTVEQRRDEVGALIRAIVHHVSPQDNLVELDYCCSEGNNKEYLETVIANEVGSNKSELLQELVQEYMGLYPELKAKKLQQRHVDVDNADYLIAYRVYDFGTYKSKALTATNRISYVKIHIRVVDMETGEVIVSDFMENKANDRLSNREVAALARTKAAQSDYGRPSSRSSKSGSDGVTHSSPSSSSSSSESSGGGLMDTLKALPKKAIDAGKGIVDKITFWK